MDIASGCPDIKRAARGLGSQVRVSRDSLHNAMSISGPEVEHVAPDVVAHF